MPEFILDQGEETGPKWFADLDDFTQGYIEAACFTDFTADSTEGLEYATLDDIADESRLAIQKDCEAFQKVNTHLLERAYDQDYDETQAGRDFWFTRNGHGVGFWDRPQLQHGIGEKLSSACGWRTAFGSVFIYRGDDRRVYFVEG